VPQFNYEAIDARGTQRKGKIQASSMQNATAQLAGMNYRITRLAPQKGSGGLLNMRIGSSKPKLEAIVVFSRQFATMIDAGIRPVQALDILTAQCDDPLLKSALIDVKEDILQGLSINEALSKHTKVFGPLFINMVAAGEAGGILALVLDRLASFLEAQQEIIDKIRSAMVYPTVVVSLALLITIGLIVGVLPKFKDIFSSMRNPDGSELQLPRMTQFLFAMSDWVKHYWLFPIVIAIGIIIAVRLYGNTPKGRYNIDLVKLKLPVFGDLILKVSVSRFARTFGTLIASGIPMMKALEIVSGTTGNAVLTQVVMESRDAIREGRKFGESIGESEYMPPLVAQMINIGEDTGRIAEMLGKVADFYEREVDVAIKSLVSMIEPMMIVFLGVIIGGIAISIISPIFTLQAALQKH
jgi:type IV pilus assembly protein PilC